MNIGDSAIFYEAIKQYQSAYEKALELFNIYEEADVEELKELYSFLYKEIEKFLNISGLEQNDCGNLGRHLYFMEYYFNRKNKEGAKSDIHDIVFFDLPDALRALISKRNTESYFDQRLKDAVFPLVQGKHYDSAIRKAFVILTERLRRAFGVTNELDGENLVNHVFGKGGDLTVALDDGKKQSYRNLISGFYGVYRNKFAHNNIEPTLSEVKTILEMTNNIIFELEDISRKSITESI